MTTNEMESVLGSLAVWNDENCHLKDFSKRHSLPCLAQVRKGEYRGVIHPEQVIYVHHVETGQKVLAEGLKQNSLLTRRGRGGIKYSLPITYAGWFEVLSEDGKQIQPIQGVEELLKIAPQQCIAREQFKTPFSAAGTEKISKEQVRQVNIGERLILLGEVDVAFQGSRGGVAKKRYLRCVDDNGDNVFLELDLKAQFSPIAGANNISGVHSLKGLLDKFRLPILVRLVYGTIPARVEKNFSPIFRLVGAYKDETAFVLPLPVQKESKMVTISTREPVFLAGAKNSDALCENREFHACKAKSINSIKSYMNSIHVLVDLPDPRTISRGKERSRIDQIKTGETKNIDSDEEEKLLFEEIEEIYRYVREGGDPPPPRIPRTSIRKESENFNNQFNDLNDLEKETESQEAVADFSIYSKEINSRGAKSTGNETSENDGYWEEPIYEEIEKIRHRKLIEKSPRSESPVTSPIALNCLAEAAKTQTELKCEEDVGVRTEAASAMVKSLRQVRNHPPPSQRQSTRIPSNIRNSEIEIEKETETILLESSPPLPPKLFEDEPRLNNAASQQSTMIKPQSVISEEIKQSVVTVPVLVGEVQKPKHKGQPPKVPPKGKQPMPDSNPRTSAYSVETNKPTINAASTPPIDRNLLNEAGNIKVNKIINEAKSKAPTTSVISTTSAIGPQVAYSNAMTKVDQIKDNKVEALINRNSVLVDEAKTAEILKSDSVSKIEKNIPSNASQILPPSSVLIAPNQLQSNAVSEQLNQGSLVSDIKSFANPGTLIQLSSKDLARTITPTTAPTLSLAKDSINYYSATPEQSKSEAPFKQGQSTYAVFKQEETNSFSAKHGPRSTISIRGHNQEAVNVFPEMSTPSTRQESTSPVPLSKQDYVIGNPVQHLQVKMGQNDRIASDFSSSNLGATPQNDPLTNIIRPQSPSRPILINANSNRINWSSASGSTIQVGADNGGGFQTTANANGVTTIRVTGSNPDPKFYPQMGGVGNTQIFVRLPNSPANHTLYRPQGSSSGFRVQSGTVYLTSNKGTDSEHWA